MTIVPGQRPLELDALRASLQRGERIRESSPDGWELHVDRQLPFLCVYRQPLDHADKGTDSLLNGQPAYLRTVVDPALHDATVELVDAIAESGSKTFGSFLVVELWAGSLGVGPVTGPAPPGFCIHTSPDTPDAFLAGVESALQNVRLRGSTALVETDFNGPCSPPGLCPLITNARMSELRCVSLGIEVSPVYREADTGVVLPFALRAMRRGITDALKMIAYRFSHSFTRYYPDHYQELGSRALTHVALNVDKQLADISENFDLLLHVTPVNASDAWLEFSKCNFERPPTFHYRPREVDPAQLKRLLYQVPVDEAEDPALIDLFASKRDELDRQITLLGDRGTDRFLHGSAQIFGVIEDELLQSARQLIALSTADSAEAYCDLLGPEDLAARAREEVDFYRLSDPTLASTVEVRNDVSGILVSHGNLLIGTDAKASKARLDATLSHEIGTHALTYHNGRKQPMRQLYTGFAGYEELQEGLAVLAEYLTGGLTLSRLKLLAGRVVAVNSLFQGAGFVDTFRLLQRDYAFEAFTSFNMTMRVFRGGGYTKDMIYLRGLLSVLEYLGGDGELEPLYCGKIAMEHLHLVDELRWRKILKPISLTPRYLTEDKSVQRLMALRSNATLDHILENLA